MTDGPIAAGDHLIQLGIQCPHPGATAIGSGGSYGSNSATLIEIP